MAKVGVALKIDVTKINKSKLFKGQKGTYLDAQVFVDLGEADQYGNHGMITQAVSQEERQNGEQGAILGNAKIFWRDQQQPAPVQQAAPGSAHNPAAGPQDTEGWDQEIPF